MRSPGEVEEEKETQNRAGWGIPGRRTADCLQQEHVSSQGSQPLNQRVQVGVSAAMGTAPIPGEGAARPGSGREHQGFLAGAGGENWGSQSHPEAAQAQKRKLCEERAGPSESSWMGVATPRPALPPSPLDPKLPELPPFHGALPGDPRSSPTPSPHTPLPAPQGPDCPGDGAVGGGDVSFQNCPFPRLFRTPWGAITGSPRLSPAPAPDPRRQPPPPKEGSRSRDVIVRGPSGRPLRPGPVTVTFNRPELPEGHPPQSPEKGKRSHVAQR
ncbi:translation initiation factor IF-2-like [Trichosurus vulpecula]|uniref:translation initiation factor IF-2-like n=1 Tax=Trichosurus vulpecula TaxID=9337 RepID=UPI00186B4ED6|nr:translation initiation factor IF-2-like [Trichosurus vulpecula]